MKYCIDFYGDRTLDLLDIADEINIELSKIKDLIDLPEFCELHKNQRINLCIKDYEDAINNRLLYFAFNFQQEQKNKYNIVIRLPYYDQEGIFQELIEKYPDSRFYFQTGCVDWDSLLIYLDLKVTDIYIVENMGFELDKIAPIVHEQGIQIRVFPNIAQSSWIKTSGLRKF